VSKNKSSSGFTLIELLVVIAIIGILSAVVLTNLNNARKRANDAKRLSEIRQLQSALALYFDKFGSYPSTSGYAFPAPSSCDGTFATALAPLVTNGFIGKIPSDPINSDSGNGRFCFFYYTNTACGSTGVTTQAYAIRFHTEIIKVRNPPWYDQGYSSGGHYCAFPLDSGL
jgi:prepilin-type N-terminal cleavage/methylation domain-containing protein